MKQKITMTVEFDFTRSTQDRPGLLDWILSQLRREAELVFGHSVPDENERISGEIDAYEISIKFEGDMER